MVKLGKSKVIDEIRGGIYKVHTVPNFHSKIQNKKILDFFGKKDMKNKISNIEGIWTKEIFMDQVRFWDSNYRCMNLTVEEDVIPTDMRFREDMLWLIYGNVEQAQKWKLALEHVYREERK